MTARTTAKTEKPAQKPADNTADNTAEKPQAAVKLEADALNRSSQAERVTVAELVGKFDWAALDTATEAEYNRGPSARDVEAETPDRIKSDLAMSYNKYDPDGNAGKGQPFWMTQKIPTKAMAEAYLKIARDYARFKGWTVRGGINDTGPVFEVRFYAKPKETRTRNSGSAS